MTRRPSAATLRMLGRFLLIGGTFSAGYALLTAGLTSLGTPPFSTAVILYAMAIPLAFAAQKRFTFPDASVHRHAFLIYLVTQLGSFAFVATLTTRFIMQDFWMDTLVYLMTAGGAAVVSFVVNRSFAFAAKA